MYKTGILIFLCAMMGASLQAQEPNAGPPPAQDTAAGETKEVEIINSDVLHFEEREGRRLTKLKGNVQLRQDQMLMYCDSASLDKDNNQMEAWGHVHIKSDTVDAYSDYLNYDSKAKLLLLQKHASLTDGKARIVSEEIFYKTRDKLAYYLTGGTVYRAKSVIVSQYAYYHTRTGDVFFNKDVDITDPDYHLTSDTLKYAVNTDVATFFGNTVIYNKTSRILCDNGWFDTKHSVASFGEHTVVLDGAQILHSDSLYYERNNGYGRSYKNFHWRDTTMDFELFGKQGDYYDEQQKVKAYDQAFMIYKMDKDSLFMRGDTLRSQHTSATDTTRIFLAYYHMKMYMHQMQGACDSMKYSFADSTFRMYYKPILWADTTQMTADTIFLTVKNRKADRLYLYNSAFIVMPSSKKTFDQIKGKNIYGYFKDNELQRMFVDGNAESLYFGKNEKNKILGANKALCVSMWIYFKDKKVKSVTFINKPEAVFTPMKMLAETDRQLKNFNWQIARQPQSREEIMGIETLSKGKHVE
jgi:lipopolysaccharide export system protein LptA